MTEPRTTSTRIKSADQRPDCQMRALSVGKPLDSKKSGRSRGSSKSGPDPGSGFEDSAPGRGLLVLKDRILILAYFLRASANPRSVRRFTIAAQNLCRSLHYHPHDCPIFLMRVCSTQDKPAPILASHHISLETLRNSLIISLRLHRCSG